MIIILSLYSMEWFVIHQQVTNTDLFFPTYQTEHCRKKSIEETVLYKKLKASHMYINIGYVGLSAIQHNLEWFCAAATVLAVQLSQSKQAFSKNGPGGIPCCFLELAQKNLLKIKPQEAPSSPSATELKKAQDFVKSQVLQNFYQNIDRKKKILTEEAH